MPALEKLVAAMLLSFLTQNETLNCSGNSWPSTPCPLFLFWMKSLTPSKCRDLMLDDIGALSTLLQSGELFGGASGFHLPSKSDDPAALSAVVPLVSSNFHQRIRSSVPGSCGGTVSFWQVALQVSPD